PDDVTYEYVDGTVEVVEVLDCGVRIYLRVGEPVVRAVNRVEPLTPRPAQPPGRAPLRAADLDPGGPPPAQSVS
ncbi:MAG: hypothetical protein JWO57_3802, partial [Pseudonocardiales bacterium]|nr:hypothetical protein [Pseudonocardiales bacterium]